MLKLASRVRKSFVVFKLKSSSSRIAVRCYGYLDNELAAIVFLVSEALRVGGFAVLLSDFVRRDVTINSPFGSR